MISKPRTQVQANKTTTTPQPVSQNENKQGRMWRRGRTQTTETQEHADLNKIDKQGEAENTWAY